MSTPSVVLERFPLGMQWPTVDPFLFCAHHHDQYPAGNDELAPAVPVTGRHIGSDFSAKDGWSMYHGAIVPGFPQHPHRGFETVTYLRAGYVDHADSLGATARFGPGDAQWMTAGAGVQHAEMMPLVNRDAPNFLHLFQIWLNLPAANKMARPAFKMFWAEDIPIVRHVDTAGRVSEVHVVAGRLGEAEAVAPPPASWAADSANDVAIWQVDMEPNAEWVLPAGRPGSSRVLYFYDGSSLELPDTAEQLTGGEGALLPPDLEVRLVAGDQPAGLVILHGRPIGEPVAQYGPFVMNTQAEVEQAFADYQRTQFGGWPWPSPDPNHGRDAGRFAIDTDGMRHEPPLVGIDPATATS
ncbi:MAG: pirin family protein [Actinomycetota bacterium]|nr:pirin family protein [Actinomycetota bacterium]